MSSIRVLALEPYYRGSHRAFLDGWVERSRHEWTLLTLPPLSTTAGLSLSKGEEVEWVCPQFSDDFAYNGTAADLARRLEDLASRFAAGDLWQGDPDRGIRIVERFQWKNLLPAMDDALNELAG
jgi:hypothetical protein